MSGWRRMLGWLLRATAAVAFVVGVMTARVLWSSRQTLADAESRTGPTEHQDRLLRLGEAARLYAPGNPWSRRALEALVAEGRAHSADSLSAWREVRSAILATRSFYTPHPELLAEADLRIAELSADAELAGKPDAAAQRPAAVAWHQRRLADSNADAPSVGWTVVALLGLFAWLGGALGFLTGAVGADDRLRTRPALAWAASIGVGLCLFYLGLARA